MDQAVSDDRVLKMERRLSAAPDKVFAAWVEPEQLVQWFAPEGLTLPHCDLDLRVGGAWSATMRQPDGRDLVVSGRYQKIERPRLLVFTWGWQTDGEPGHQTEITLDFRAEGSGTVLTLTQRAFATVEDRDMHTMGWSSSLTNLARLVEA
jgi:uncharacterized protein YndB with AHSA1/START domain